MNDRFRSRSARGEFILLRQLHTSILNPDERVKGRAVARVRRIDAERQKLDFIEQQAVAEILRDFNPAPQRCPRSRRAAKGKPRASQKQPQRRKRQTDRAPKYRHHDCQQNNERFDGATDQVEALISFSETPTPHWASTYVHQHVQDSPASCEDSSDDDALSDEELRWIGEHYRNEVNFSQPTPTQAV